MNRFATSTIAEDRAAMSNGMRDQMIATCSRITDSLQALTDWAWADVAHPEYAALADADLELAAARAERLEQIVATLRQEASP